MTASNTAVVLQLSNRLWRAIGHRFSEREDPAEIMVWAKVRHEAVGKRHYVRPIALTEREFIAVARLALTCRDDYFVFCLAHETETNPLFPKLDGYYYCRFPGTNPAPAPI